MLYRDFARDVKKEANGDGSREAKFAFLRRVRRAAGIMSTPEIVRRRVYLDAIKKCGRVPVAICFAVTILRRRDQLSAKPVAWAEAVLALWKNRPGNSVDGYIDDNLHPSRIEEYAKDFITLTWSEWEESE